ncbi:hypothetical protein ES703_58473 [subsurface metagenome]
MPITVTRRLVKQGTVSDYAPDWSRRIIAVDSTGRIYVVVSTGASPPQSNKDIILMYSDNEGVSWSEETIVSGDYYKYWVCLAIDSNDDLHVVYTCEIDSTPWMAKYLKGTPGSWSAVETIDATNMMIGFDLAIDSNDVPHVVTRQTIAGVYYIRHYWRDGAWSVETVFTDASYYSSDPMLAIDEDDKLHLTYMYDTGDRPIQYRQKPSGGSWSAAETAIASPGRSFRSFVATDGDKDIHVVAEMGLMGRYNKRAAGGGWDGEEDVKADSDGPGAFPVLSIDLVGNIWCTGAQHRFWKERGEGSWVEMTENNGDTRQYTTGAIVAQPSAVSVRIPSFAILPGKCYHVYFDGDSFRGCWLLIQDAGMPARSQAHVI